ncbi:hypothetical protein OG21DRAFT_1409610, partial [Imleria badia]
TNVSCPTVLQTATLHRQCSAANALVDQNSDEYLDNTGGGWNKKLDAEVEVLVDGMMVDIVSLASAIGDKDKFRIAQESFQAESRAESTVRAANSVLSITHSLKLLVLQVLSDEAQIVHRPDVELKHMQQVKIEVQQKIAAQLKVSCRSLPPQVLCCFQLFPWMMLRTDTPHTRCVVACGPITNPVVEHVVMTPMRRRRDSTNRVCNGVHPHHSCRADGL